MIAVGLILLILGLIFGIYILWVLGIILLAIGLVFWFVPFGGRTCRWY